VVVTGCYAQLRPEEISRIEGVDLVLGAKEKFRVFEFAENFEKNQLSCVYVSPTETLNEFNSAYSTDADARTRAFFKIQDGCDYKCTFCTIPLARGKSRSQSSEQLVEDFKKLLQKGYKEIILTGVNIGDYGKNVNYNLYKLLKDFISIEGDFRIRISSIEPNLLTEEIIKLTAESKKLAKHFHIPLQSGSDKVLRLMKRRYDSSLYKKLIYKVKEIIPDAGIGVDVIVGTPGETEEDFQTTYEFIKNLPVSYLHVFTYSERPNTEAILMEGKVEQAEKKRRNNLLRILGEKKKTAFYKEQIGKELEVLFEHTEKDGNIEGFSSNYVRVRGASNFDLVNRLTNVKIVNANGEYCYSE
jgi:threonylcarbamoyladenosine tRNA methylthiotransferase MtaB